MFTIARNTFRETIRDKVLYVALLFALGFTVVSMFVSEWSLGNEDKILTDFGLTVIAIFSLAISLFLGIGLVYKEIEKKTIYPILSKPIGRSQFLIGKFLGLLATIFVVIYLMTVVLFLIIWLMKGDVGIVLFVAVFMVFLKMAIVIAVALFFTTVSSPILSAILTLFIFFTGNFSGDMKMLTPGLNTGITKDIIQYIYYLIPNFDLLDLSLEAVYGLEYGYSKILKAFLYTTFYCTALLSITSVLFKKRDLQ